MARSRTDAALSRRGVSSSRQSVRAAPEVMPGSGGAGRLPAMAVQTSRRSRTTMGMAVAAALAVFHTSLAAATIVSSATLERERCDGAGRRFLGAIAKSAGTWWRSGARRPPSGWRHPAARRRTVLLALAAAWAGHRAAGPGPTTEDRRVLCVAAVAGRGRRGARRGQRPVTTESRRLGKAALVPITSHRLGRWFRSSTPSLRLPTSMRTPAGSPN